MLSPNRLLPAGEIKPLFLKTSRQQDGFRVLDAEAAVKAAQSQVSIPRQT